MSSELKDLKDSIKESFNDIKQDLREVKGDIKEVKEDMRDVKDDIDKNSKDNKILDEKITDLEKQNSSIDKKSLITIATLVVTSILNKF